MERKKIGRGSPAGESARLLRGRHGKWSENSEYLRVSCSLLKHRVVFWSTLRPSFFHVRRGVKIWHSISTTTDLQRRLKSMRFRLFTLLNQHECSILAGNDIHLSTHNLMSFSLQQWKTPSHVTICRTSVNSCHIGIWNLVSSKKCENSHVFF